MYLTLSRPNKLSSANFLFCFNIQSVSMSLKIGENVVRVSNILDPGETPSFSPSHPDPICLHYGTMDVLGGLRVQHAKVKVE